MDQKIQHNMTSDTKDIQNFRSNYYHKLGSTSAVEEKKNLTKLLSSVPLDLRKLEQFCHHLHVPNDLRCELWKILLKISPKYQTTREFVSQQRMEHFTELNRIVKVMRMVPGDSPDPDLYEYTAMYLVENKTYMLTFEHIYELAEAKLFKDIISAVSRLDCIDCDTYWISRNFTNLVREKVHPIIPYLSDRAHMSLQKEDTGGKLISHLHQVGVYDKIPYAEWFANCFSSTLPETTYERVWDKVMSGASVVLAYVAVALLLTHRRPILVMSKPQEVLHLFTQIQTDTAEEIVRRGIEMWQRNGAKLTPSSSRASPAVHIERSPTPNLTSVDNSYSSIQAT